MRNLFICNWTRWDLAEFCSVPLAKRYLIAGSAEWLSLHFKVNPREYYIVNQVAAEQGEFPWVTEGPQSRYRR